MLRALHYCHSVIKVVHRDIKPDNIMLNHNREAVLIDFGLSALVEQDEKLNTNMGSYMFFAPEMFNRSQGGVVIGEKTDMWALGITFYYLLTGRYPSQHVQNLIELKENITQKEFDFSFIKHPDAREVI